MTPSDLPRHVAIIMDGNGRWAARRRRPRFFGHVRGSRQVKTIVREAGRVGIEALTLYAFSTENWARPDSELTVLWKLMRKYLIRERAELMRENVRLRVIGDLDRLEPGLRQVVDETVSILSDNTGLQLTFAISYGARRELARAARLFAEDVARGNRKPEEMSEEVLESYLWTAPLDELSDVDLVIRTSGERRVSNFLLWQSAYAEFLFTELCWPDFGVEAFHAAIDDFAGRDRRFGGVALPLTSSTALHLSAETAPLLEGVMA